MTQKKTFDQIQQAFTIKSTQTTKKYRRTCSTLKGIYEKDTQETLHPMVKDWKLSRSDGNKNKVSALTTASKYRIGNYGQNKLDKREKKLIKVIEMGKEKAQLPLSAHDTILHTEKPKESTSERFKLITSGKCHDAGETQEHQLRFCTPVPITFWKGI